MVIMLTYRCSLDCDHCMIYATGPRGEHMSQWVLECSMKVFRQTRSNQLGIAGGEPLEHPDFWDILKGIRQSSLRRGFAVRVATSGVPFDEDPSLIEKVAQAAPVLFQVTNDTHFYKPLEHLRELRKLSNVYFQPLTRYYHSRKATERGFENPGSSSIRRSVMKSGPRDRRSLFCEPAWWLRKHVSSSLNFGAFVRLWEGYHDLCTIHVHPDGSIKMGPIDCCHSLGNVVTMSENYVSEGRRAITAMGDRPCRRCGLKGEVR